MDAAGTIVVGSGVFSGALRTLESTGGSELDAIAGDDDERVRLRAALAHAQLELRREQTDTGVLASPRDPMGARLQSFLAERAEEAGKVQSAASGLEAKYDTKDLLGWLIPYPGEWLHGRDRGTFPPLPA